MCFQRIYNFVCVYTDKQLLKEMEKKSNEYMDPLPLPPDSMVPPDHPPPSPPSQDEETPPHSSESDFGQSHRILDEDDHFGQLLFSLGNADFPKELILSEDTFLIHIVSYTRTLVAFYVPCEITLIIIGVTCFRVLFEARPQCCVSSLPCFCPLGEPQCEAVMHYMLQAMEDLPEGTYIYSYMDIILLSPCSSISRGHS